MDRQTDRQTEKVDIINELPLSFFSLAFFHSQFCQILPTSLQRAQVG